MKINEFDFDTDYATCDGRRVRLVRFDGEDKARVRACWLKAPIVNAGEKFTDPAVEPVWNGLIVADKTRITRHYLPANANPLAQATTVGDPWGPCKTNRRPNQGGLTHMNTVWDDEMGCWVVWQKDTNVAQGPLFEILPIDEDGDVIEDMRRQKGDYERATIATRDIPGTWGEYMTLHAEDVRLQALENYIHAERKRINTRIQARTSELPSGASVAYRALWSTERTTFGADNEIQVNLSGEAALEYLKGKKVINAELINAGVKVVSGNAGDGFMRKLVIARPTSIPKADKPKKVGAPKKRSAKKTAPAKRATTRKATKS